MRVKRTPKPASGIELEAYYDTIPENKRIGETERDKPSQHNQCVVDVNMVPNEAYATQAGQDKRSTSGEFIYEDTL